MSFMADARAVDQPAAPVESDDQSACTSALLRGAELAALDAEQWDSLSDRSIEPNPFYGRDLVRAGIEALAEGAGLQALAFRRRSDNRLVGLFPFRHRRLPLLSNARSALNVYQVGGVPLIDDAHADDVASAFLGLVRSGRDAPSRWAFSHVELEGAFARLMAHHAAQDAAEVVKSQAYDRPVLTRAAGSFDAHVETVIGRKRAKDIQRNLRRLRDLGSVRFERAADPERVAERLDQFLVMECSGWKGQRGTAFLSKPAHAHFARMAFAGRSVIIDSVLLDDKPIALCINLAAGASLFAPKCAFDESYRRYGVGLLLEYLVIDRFYADGRFAEMNACTTVDGHIVSGLWNDARPMGTLIVGPRDWRTRSLARVEDATRATRQWAKRVIPHLNVSLRPQGTTMSGYP